jgi:GMP synthase-like glutamine amidotransferase
VRVLSITHGELVRSELFGEVVLDAGHELVEWEIGTGPRPAGDFAAVLVLGGHMNVGEEAEYQWLADEYELLRGLVAAGTPLFAVCLGAQTLAHALGARVERLPARQAGFVEVTLTAAGSSDPVLGALPPRFEALVGNAYGFEVPSVGIELATSPVQPQAYRIGAAAWAVQFHPEARRGQVLRWFESDEEALPRPLAELERELEAKIDGWHRLGRRLCLAFLDAADGSTAQPP